MFDLNDNNMSERKKQYFKVDWGQFYFNSKQNLYTTNTATHGFN